MRLDLVDPGKMRPEKEKSDTSPPWETPDSPALLPEESQTQAPSPRQWPENPTRNRNREPVWARRIRGAVRNGCTASRPLRSRSGNIGTAYASLSKTLSRAREFESPQSDPARVASPPGTALTVMPPVLTLPATLCYGSGLGAPFHAGKRKYCNPFLFRSILDAVCRVKCFGWLLVFILCSAPLGAQSYTPAVAPPPQPAQVNPNPDRRILPRPNMPDAHHVHIRAVTQESDGPERHLRGSALVETVDTQLKADEIDYNDDTGDAEARGHVHFENFETGEKLDCDHAEYNTDEKTGKFYDVSGSSPSRIQARPGLLTTNNPFYFQGQWAERLKDHYILYDGFITDCLIPRPWWILKGPKFIVVPGDHAIAQRAWFRLRGVPIFYMPAFYKSLKKEPRRSGFLVPNIGNSSARGKMIGFGYYWAINRSYDLSYRAQYFTTTGFAHQIDFRGQVNRTTGYDFTFYGLQDTRGLVPSDSGALITIHAHSNLGDGWKANGELNYLTSFAFRQQFTESFNEAVSSETHSVGYVTKHWSDYGINIVAQRNVNFQSTAPGDAISTRKLPELQFSGRDHEVDVSTQPFWISFDSSAGLERRSQPLFQTRQFVSRVDLAPHVTTAFRWKGIELIPSLGVRETFYDSSLDFPAAAAPGGSDSPVLGRNLLRSSRDVTVDVLLTPLERVFDAPAWMGDKVKHVVEPRITYKYVTGVENFDQIIRFDEADLLTDTNQVEFSLTNRLLAKDKNGTVTDFITWQLFYDRYLDPTFGGAVVAGQKNVIESSIDLTGYAFLDGPRHQSPVVSALRLQSRVGLEWRADYDPARQRLADSSVTVDGRIHDYFWSIGHTDLSTSSVLAPAANQLRATLGYGNNNRRGWNYGFSGFYDYLKSVLQYAQTQVTYNTDCCGFSFQYRRFNLGTRDDTQFLVAFAISNIGTFGTLKRQERIF